MDVVEMELPDVVMDLRCSAGTYVRVLAQDLGRALGCGGYMAALLVMEAGMIGVFVSLDLFLFFLFWEIMLIPMYFIIGIWGGKRRIYATVKFFIFTMTGSVLMLAAMLASSSGGRR